MKLNRRNFARLGALGAVSGILPAASVMAQPSGGRERRFLSIFTTLGQMPEWRPTQGADGMILSEQCASLTPFQDKLLFVGGTRASITLGMTGSHTHGAMSNFTGQGSRAGRHNDRAKYEQTRKPSVDQLIAAERSSQALALGAASAEERAVISFRAPRRAGALAQPVQPELNPVATFNSMFRDFGRSAEELEKLRVLRSSVLDVWSRRLPTLRQQISVESRSVLDAHMDRVRELEVKFTKSAESCDVDARPPRPKDFPQTLRLQMDNIVSGFACNIATTASLTFDTAQSKRIPSWASNTKLTHHALSHEATEAANVAALTDIYTWQTEQVAYLLTKLAETPDSNGVGSLLDNTVVYWASENGTHTTHLGNDMVSLIVGSDYFQGNKYHFAGGNGVEPAQNDILSELYTACTGKQTMVYNEPRLNARNEFPELRA